MANFAKQLKIGYPSTLLLKCQKDTIIKGYLLNYPKTVFFKRRIGHNGITKFPLPFEIEKIVVVSSKPFEFVAQEPIDTLKVYLPERVESFLNFAKEFSYEASYLEENTAYESDESNNAILFVDKIYNERNGKKVESPTPARISRATGRIQLNASKFKKLTVPQRIFMLLHEYMHFELNSSSEFEVDLHALRAYLSLGFSRIESVYALTKVLHESEFSHKRVKLLIDYIKKFEA